MLNLIVKDLRLHRRFLLTTGLLFPLYMGYFGSRLSTPTIASIFGGFLYGLIPIIVFSREDKFKAVGFGLSLPTTRREVLRSRYALGWLLMAAYYLASSFLMIIIPGGQLGPEAIFNVRTILLALAAMTLVFSSLMPLSVRFGMAGLMVFLVAIQVLGIFLLLLRITVGPKAAAVIHTLPRSIAAAVDALGPAGAAAAVLVLLVILSAISLGIARRVFAKKEY